MTDKQIHEVLIRSYWSGMPLDKSIDFYLSIPVKQATGRGARLKNNIKKYWRNLVEQKDSLIVDRVKHLYWFEHYSVYAVLKKLGDTTQKDKEVFSWEIMDRVR